MTKDPTKTELNDTDLDQATGGFNQAQTLASSLKGGTSRGFTATDDLAKINSGKSGSGIVSADEGETI